MALRGRNKPEQRKRAKNQSADPVGMVAQPCPASKPPRATTLDEKKTRLAERNQLIQTAETRAAGSDVDGTPEGIGLKNAAERLRTNNKVVERARLADDVYDRDPERDPNSLDSAPVGWKRLKNYANPKDQKNSFHAALYESEIDGSKVLVFEGTSERKDWGANLKQGVGMETYQYKRAIDIAEDEVENFGSDLELSGHSLGGGLASAGAGVTGSQTYTFNSAGLHPKTVKREGGSIQAAIKSTQSRYIKGEILTMAQKYGELPIKGLTFAGLNATLGPIVGAIGAAALPEFPDAVGTLTALEPVLKGSPLAKHGMEHVIAAIESQKRQDIAALKQGLR